MPDEQLMTYPASFNEIEEWRNTLRRTVSPAQLIHAIENRIQHESDAQRLRILNFFLANEHSRQGNEAAADAIYDNDPILETHRWCEEWRRENGNANFIPVLEQKLCSETHPMKIRALRSFLADEYGSRGDYASASAVRLDAIKDDPSEPMPLISLASQKFYDEDQPDEAMRIIDQAVDVALRSGTYRRLALGHRARIALHQREYRIVEEVLKQLVGLKFTRGNADIGVERDFFDALPPDSIDAAVAQQYDDYCRARGKARGADSPREPPEWDDHEEG
jgi:hypothetical protein